MSDVDDIDFFRSGPMLANPYPYYEQLRERCPVHREPHEGVVMITGYDEALAVYHDVENVLVGQLGDGAVPRVQRPARGRRRQRPHRAAPRRAALQRPAPDLRPAEAHRAPRADSCASSPRSASRRTRRHVAARRPPDRRVHRRRELRAHRRLRVAVRHARHRRPPRRPRGGPTGLPGPARPDERLRDRRGGHDGAHAAGVPLREVHRLRRGPTAPASRRHPDPPGAGDVPRRLDPGGDRRRPSRGEPVRGRSGDHRSAARHGVPVRRRAARPAAVAAGRTTTASRTSSRRSCGSRARSRATSASRGCRPPSGEWTSPQAPP